MPHRPHSVHVQQPTTATAHTTPEVEALVPTWLSLPQIAQMMQVPITKVRQLVADREVVALRRGQNSALYVPADFFVEGQPMSSLASVLTVLADGGFDDLDSVKWLFTPEQSLQATPVQALAANRGTSVRRLAQSSAW